MSRIARALARGALPEPLAAISSTWTAQKQWVILDDDLDGCAPAPVMALQAPDVEVPGIITVSGNAWVTQAAVHARRLETTGHPDAAAWSPGRPAIARRRGSSRAFVNAPRRECNIRFDPEAASIVMRAPWKTRLMAQVDPSTAIEVTAKPLVRMRAAHTPIARPLAFCQTGFPPCDGLAVAVRPAPSLITESTK